MGIGRSFARHRAQAKALRFVKTGGLQFSIVEGKPLRFALFNKQLAIIGTLQGLRYKIGRLCLGGIAVIEK